ncbi:hypothetical protein GRI42_00230 [Erythrobacter gaetbuli]|uniref:Uncharacterized protein n=1 Tax=Qipengyuania gaetbuli TaxID=266952 RepID=A0A844XV09_9SPHN|nr:DUF5676 family membrane protein [Qipengyuania gaetbuli]MXO49731.1 hypothetical protein [Qipengyuania gaetbuli]
MKINAFKLSISTAAVFGAAWVICSLLVIGAPQAMMQVTGHMVHADFSHMNWQLNSSGLVVGLLAWSIGAGLIAGATAVVYNRLVD